MKTTKAAKPHEVEKQWHLIDADGLVVGRVATIVANIDTLTMERMVGAVLRRHGQAISVQHNCITPAHVALAKRRQITLWCWSADGRGDNEADWQRLVNAGVDGIMTEDPDRLRRFLKARVR